MLAVLLPPSVLCGRRQRPELRGSYLDLIWHCVNWHVPFWFKFLADLGGGNRALQRPKSRVRLHHFGLTRNEAVTHVINVGVVQIIPSAGTDGH
jgi:hypothetical protein